MRLLVPNENSVLTAGEKVERVLDVIKSAGPEGIKKSVLNNRTQWAKREQKEIVSYLFALGEIASELHGSSVFFWSAGNYLIYLDNLLEEKALKASLERNFSMAGSEKC